VGLKVNLSKSALVPVGSRGEVDQLVGVLGCGIGDLPLKYLGLPLRASFQAESYVGGFGKFDVAAVGSLETVISFQGG
jgi:hypothetical protein